MADAPVPTASTSETVPLAERLNVARLSVPALAMTRWPAASNEMAKGTVAASGFTTGDADGTPNGPTPNTSMSLPLAFVVTMSCEPDCENAT